MLAVVFALGLGVGASVGPVGASRGSASPAASVATPAARAQPEGVRAAHPAEVLRVFDGDTFEARVHLWPGLEVTTRVRLRGVDAPELKARCHDERVKAEAARDALKALLDRGEVGISKVTLDKYGGRVVANASAAAIPDVGAELIAAGLVRRYSGGRRESWCP
jgi:endonuclease YncB( thermonuclease family)